jgi:hypothetical protein
MDHEANLNDVRAMDHEANLNDVRAMDHEANLNDVRAMDHEANLNDVRPPHRCCSHMIGVSTLLCVFIARDVSLVALRHGSQAKAPGGAWAHIICF